MKNSKHYRDLIRRLSELRKHLLPRQFSPTGVYSSRVLDIARGYRVLAHAEIESYLEAVANEAIDNAYTLMKVKSKASYLLVSFLSAYHRGWSYEPGQEGIFGLKPGAKDQKALLDGIDVAVRQYKQTILKNNNGIKIANLKMIFLPLGVDIDGLDAAWLGTIESYGRRRGEIAHSSKRIQTLIDPKDEFSATEQVMAGLSIFDENFLKACKK